MVQLPAQHQHWLRTCSSCAFLRLPLGMGNPLKELAAQVIKALKALAELTEELKEANFAVEVHQKEHQHLQQELADAQLQAERPKSTHMAVQVTLLLLTLLSHLKAQSAFVCLPISSATHRYCSNAPSLCTQSNICPALILRLGSSPAQLSQLVESCLA